MGQSPRLHMLGKIRHRIGRGDSGSLIFPVGIVVMAPGAIFTIRQLTRENVRGDG
jgi:hypothetical protein